MQKNQTIRNNAIGETLTMLVSEDENNGTCQLYEGHLPLNRPSPRLHYHVDSTETFTVKSGKLDFYVGTEQRRLSLQPGDSITVQLRQPHRFANDHDERFAETDFRLRGVRCKNYRHGEKLAGLLFLGRVVM